MVGLLAATVAPAAAATTFTGGVGAETMVGVAFSLDPNKPCAHYTRYQADVVFANGGNPVNATIASGTSIWNEGPGGTYQFAGPGVNNCPKYPYATPTYPVPGFLVTLTGGMTCIATPATYERKDISITVTLQGPAPCGGTILKYDLAYSTTTSGIPPFFDPGDPVAYCAPIIAPAACVIGPPGPPIP
jgi:hypothetical protein